MLRRHKGTNFFSENGKKGGASTKRNYGENFYSDIAKLRKVRKQQLLRHQLQQRQYYMLQTIRNCIANG